ARDAAPLMPYTTLFRSWDGDDYAARARAFGWRAIEIDGHDVAEIDRAYREASDVSSPTLLVARTVKGHGVSFLADQEGWHGKALDRKSTRLNSSHVKTP